MHSTNLQNLAPLPEEAALLFSKVPSQYINAFAQKLRILVTVCNRIGCPDDALSVLDFSQRAFAALTGAVSDPKKKNELRLASKRVERAVDTELHRVRGIEKRKRKDDRMEQARHEPLLSVEAQVEQDERDMRLKTRRPKGVFWKGRSF